MSLSTRVHVKPSMLKPEAVSVVVNPDNPELLNIRLGNSTLTMHYEDALKLSQWIRVRAKEAKRMTGDMSRHWSMLASLDGTPAEGIDRKMFGNSQ